MTLRHAAITVTCAAVAAVAATAVTAPVVARSVFDADNAHKVDGLHAKDLTRTDYFIDDTDFDNFDTCEPWATLTAQHVTTPHSGMVTVVHQVQAARDSGSAEEALLTVFVKIDGKRAGIDASANLENNGVWDDSITATAARKVAAGRHTIKVLGRECANGVAFIEAQSMAVTFSPFGSVHVIPTQRAEVSRNR